MIATGNMIDIIIIFICLDFYNPEIQQVFPSSSFKRLIGVYVIATSKFEERAIRE